MNIRHGFFELLLGVALFVAVLFPAGLYGEERVYTVKKGETFYSIARTLGVRADDLMKHNGISDPSRLQEGQRLRIPEPGGQAASALSGTGYTTYRVVRGDTFYGIARKFSVTERNIREANGLAPNYVLREGDSLKIPTGNGTSQTATAGGTGTSLSTRTDTGGQDTRALISSVGWPISARELSYMTGKLSGVVLTGTRAETVKSLTWGTVLSAGPYRGFGRVAIVQVEGGYLYVYGGCESLSVKEGDKVGPGTELGRLGVDAVSAKPQLFFMVYRSNNPVDPARAPRA